MKRTAYVVSVLALLAGTGWAQDVPDKRPISFSPSGPAGDRTPRSVNVLAIDSDLHVGQPVPGFALDGARGQVVRRADLSGRWAVLVFDEVRRRFATLEAIRAPLERMGVRLYGVCPDGWTALRDYSRRHSLSFELLSDPTRQVSQVFDMVDRSSGAIRAGLVIVDPAGVVRRVLDDQAPDGPAILDLVQLVVSGSESLAAGDGEE